MLRTGMTVFLSRCPSNCLRFVDGRYSDGRCMLLQIYTHVHAGAASCSRTCVLSPCCYLCCVRGVLIAKKSSETFELTLFSTRGFTAMQWIRTLFPDDGSTERAGVDAVQGGPNGRADARDGRRCGTATNFERHALPPQEGGRHRQRSARLQPVPWLNSLMYTHVSLCTTLGRSTFLRCGLWRYIDSLLSLVRSCSHFLRCRFSGLKPCLRGHR